MQAHTCLAICAPWSSLKLKQTQATGGSKKARSDLISILVTSMELQLCLRACHNAGVMQHFKGGALCRNRAWLNADSEGAALQGISL